MKKNKLLKILLFSLLLVPVVGVTTKILNTNSNNVNISFPNKSDNVINEVAVTLDDNSTVMSSNIQIVSNKQEVLSASKDKLCIVNDDKDLSFKLTNNNFFDFNFKENCLFEEYVQAVNYKEYIYFFCDSNVYKYNTNNMTFYNLDCDISSYLGGSEFCVVNNYIYFYEDYGTSLIRFNCIDEYFETIDVVIPQSLSYFSTCAYDNCFYLIGGDIKDDDGEFIECSNKIYKFDIFLNEFNLVSELPIGLDCADCFLLNDKIYICNGYDSDGEEINKTYIYNIKNNSIDETTIFESYDLHCYGQNCIYSIYVDSNNLMLKIIDIENSNTYEKVIDISSTFLTIYNGFSIDTDFFNLINGKLYFTYKDIIWHIDLSNYKLYSNSNYKSFSTTEQHNCCGYANVNNYLYIFGSIDDSKNFSKSIYRYNLDDNSKEIMNTTLPDSIFDSKCIVYGDFIYIIGGVNYLSNSTYNKIMKYNYKTDSIEILDFELIYSKGTIGTSASISLYENKIYFFTFKSIIKYYLDTDTYEEIDNSFDIEFYESSSITFNNYIYLIGGSNSYNNDGLGIYKFNCETECFENDRVELKQPISNPGCTIYDNCIYIFGNYGYNSNIKSHLYIYKYNPVTNEITSEDNLQFGSITYAYNIHSFVYENRIYLFGGTLTKYTKSQVSPKFIFYFEKNDNLDKNNILIYNADSEFLFKLNNNLSISPNKIYIGSSTNNPELAEAYLYSEEQSSWINVNTGEALEVGDSNA